MQGGGARTVALETEINRVGAQGTVFVAAAGNNNYNLDTTSTYPVSSNLPNMIGVLATAKDAAGYESKASYSNFGSSGAVHIGAPGSDIYSSIVSGYGVKSGTSMACPLVAGETFLDLVVY